jgi:hypothetical protein
MELGRARALVRRHFLRVLERAGIGEIGGDPSCTESMTADRRREADNALPLCPRAVRNSQPLRSSAIPAASM